ncbi:MAG: SWIM zinc finger family protein, partial [Nocardioidaceae bacterium]
MPDVMTLPSDPAIREVVGAAAFLRGSAYAHEGRVDKLQVSHRAGTIFAHVVGTAARPYQTIVVIDDETAGISAHCTCPVGGDCKHAAAAIIAARNEVATQAVGPDADGWRGPLDDLVRAHNEEFDKQARPLGLQFDLVTVFAGYSRPASRRVTLRPVTTGRRGTWIRSGTSWSEFGQHNG